MKKIPTTTRNGSPPSNPSPVASALPNGTFEEPDAALLDQAALDTAVEDAIVSFLEKHDQVNYAPGMVYVCLTLADWLFMPPSVAVVQNIDYHHDADILSSCFAKMMYVILWSPTICSTPIEPSDSVINQRISHFLTTFRQLLPELARYFDEEEVASFGEQWVFTWIQWWCAGELGKDEKGRLWDWYLGFEQPVHGIDSQQTRSNAIRGDCADSRGFHPDDIYYPSDWHILVCVALLKSRKDALEELEQSEIRSVLTRLPKVDMNMIISVRPPQIFPQSDSFFSDLVITGSEVSSGRTSGYFGTRRGGLRNPVDWRGKQRVTMMLVPVPPTHYSVVRGRTRVYPKNTYIGKGSYKKRRKQGVKCFRRKQEAIRRNMLGAFRLKFMSL